MAAAYCDFQDKYLTELFADAAPGSVTMLYGLPAAAKTCLMAYSALQLAEARQGQVFYATFQEGWEDLAERFMGIKASVDMSKRAEVNASIENLRKAVSDLEDIKLHFIELFDHWEERLEAIPPVDDVRHEKDWQRLAVFVDHITAIPANPTYDKAKAGTRQQEILDAIMLLKKLAKEKNAAVFVVSTAVRNENDESREGYELPTEEQLPYPEMAQLCDAIIAMRTVFNDAQDAATVGLRVESKHRPTRRYRAIFHPKPRRFFDFEQIG